MSSPQQLVRTPDLKTLQRRIRVALGQEPGDTVISGGRIVNVFTQQVEPGNVVIADGWIAGVGPFDWEGGERLDARGQCLVPGLIDGHIHIESTLLTPGELARLMVPHGTAALVADPHEIGNVLGIPGIDMILRISERLPLDFYFMACSCVPDASWEDSGAVLDVAAIEQILDRPRIRGLAEVMDFPAVLGGQPGMLDKILAAQRRGVAVDGHAPGLLGRNLVAYASAGIRSDHESTTVDEALQKATLGMMVQVREGSSERNLDTLMPLLVEDRLGDWCLCSDDIHPDDLVARGHLDGLLRRVIAAGVPPPRAIRHATWVPARHYGFRNRGGIAPGFRADLAIIDDLESFQVRTVFKDGQIVARDGTCMGTVPTGAVACGNSVNLAPVDESAFQLRLHGVQCPAIGIVPDQIVTTMESVEVATRDGLWQFDPDKDVVLIASLERHRRLGRVGVGLVAGLGLRKHGAIASSVAHDSHNLIVAGTNPSDMLRCVRSLAESGGGWVVATDGEVRARLPLPFAGLMSLEPAAAVCQQLEELHAVTRSLGCQLPYPFGTLSFLALPVIPSLRITDQGLFQVETQSFITY